MTFLEGLVEDFTKNSNILKVKINGTYKYTVKIELGENDEDEIIDDEYNCPYAQTGFYCKHVVAVLYEYFDKYIIKEQATEDVLFKSNLSDEENKIKKIAELIDKAKYNDLKEYLIKILMNNRDLLSSFYSAVNKDFNDKELLEYKLPFILDKINELDKLNNECSSWYKENYVSKWVLACLEIYKNNNYPQKDIEKLCNSFFEYKKIKLFYIGYCVDKKEYEKALDMIDEILKVLDDKYFNKDILKIKKNIYLSQNQKLEYIKVL